MKWQLKISPKAQQVIERLLPYLIAIGVSTWLSSLSLPVRMRMEKDLGNAVLTVVSIITAISATSLTIAISQPDGIKYIKEKHHEQYLLFIDYHIETITVGVFASILSLIVLMLSPVSLEKIPISINIYHVIAFFFWQLTSVSTIFTFFRLSYLLRRILSKIR
jgi:hypothetical protein